jgi:RNA polymerase sigma-70 factor (ECF subfamily)
MNPNLAEVGEQTLIEMATRDPAAFRALYRRYHGRVFAYVAYRVGRAEDAEDVTAEVFVRVVAGLGRFQWRGDGSFSAWLFRIAHHETARYHGRAQREAIPLDSLPELHSTGLSPDQEVQRKEQFARLRAAIDRLAPRRQEIIRLKFFAELRNKEIAAILKLDERTVAAHLSRGLADLQRALADEAQSAPSPDVRPSTLKDARP